MLWWTILITLSIPIGWWAWQARTKLAARREAERLSRALKISHAVFRAVDQIPQGLISRDLRRGLVLLLVHHLEILRRLNPLHPHIAELERRMQRLNQIPSGLIASRLRTKLERRQAAHALEELSTILKEAPRQNALEQKIADLARAAAVFAERHIAVESARQSAKDAENMRAYPAALNFAYKAQSLCRSLPPLVGKSLLDAVGRDIERLEAKTQTAR